MTPGSRRGGGEAGCAYPGLSNPTLGYPEPLIILMPQIIYKTQMVPPRKTDINPSMPDQVVPKFQTTGNPGKKSLNPETPDHL